VFQRLVIQGAAINFRHAADNSAFPKCSLSK
jgi:hypothetical protein